jgi:hypothetical protein
VYQGGCVYYALSDLQLSDQNSKQFRLQFLIKKEIRAEEQQKYRHNVASKLQI